MPLYCCSCRASSVASSLGTLRALYELDQTFDVFGHLDHASLRNNLTAQIITAYFVNGFLQVCCTDDFIHSVGSQEIATPTCSA